LEAWCGGFDFRDPDQIMKICNRCHKPKEDKKFNKGSKRCAKCSRELQRDHYKRNKETYVRKLREKRVIIKEFIESCKIECLKCGEDHPSCLDFHHRDPKEKEFAIANWRTFGYSIKKLETEIKKCDILCANCHRKIHWKEKGVWPNVHV